MRITFVLPPVGMSGGIRVIAMHAKLLSARGHTVTVVHPPSQQAPLKHRLRRFLQGEGWLRHPRVYPSHLDGLALERKVLEMYRPVTAADVPDADVVIATWWETAEWVNTLPAEKGVKVYFLQGLETLEGQPAERVKRTWTLRMHKIVVSEWLAGIARETYGDTDVSLVPNSVDLALFQAPPRGKHSVSTVGFNYTFLPYKGCDVIAQAVGLARREVPALKVRAFGLADPEPKVPMPEGAEYEKDPPQARIPAIYASCDAWLSASRFEGFGLPILEAMACRTPVIATPAGAAPELLAGGCGILIEQEDAEAMARAMIRVCRMPNEEWRELSGRAYLKAASYTWDDASDLFEKALVHAVSAPGKALP
ncbi:MAG: glycosyltransferase family 4 protein [Candidatus Hydrogenedentes bacterium]|nr:glycosyltransferase family 4 protein [Candidatus Hydrogenedentota bacterium]